MRRRRDQLEGALARPEPERIKCVPLRSAQPVRHGDGNALDATVTVDDPGAFKAPWSGMIRWQKVNRPIMEWACAENNLGYEQAFELQEYPMPVANTQDF